ncbi:maleylpyruvate isomerase family mycothiol-dependent enzyme [Streptomyces sp. SID5785]|uniref:maleylpyruvate isomerase N-terminal domain-containing protein n=1 Tax=Streptomyces sp. SID5785 TaxID=2690309 RepID=UPI001361A7A0|nr:maleylpyruvate isomerase family mycothiol-dependent enzyme [Streptomyces sp. SID5785]MZD05706.1 maleylpyruvate isomerase family mycothiol-dependent enzyme [Streptomyces sp. SID5785]
MTPHTASHGLLTHERYCAEIVAQTVLLRQHLAGADLSVTVPSCPDWSLRELAVHVGGAHRWAATIVRTRASEEVPDEAVPDFTGPDDEDPAALDAWLAEGAALLAAELRAAGAGLPVWSWSWQRDAGFWARRMTHETVIHRADAALAAKADYDVAPDVVADTVEEWLRIVRFAQDTYPEDTANELRRGGRSLHLHATDVPAGGAPAEWFVELADDGLVWRHEHARADVALRGPLTALLLAFYRRTSPDDPALEVVGDRGLLDFWLERATFG